MRRSAMSVVTLTALLLASCAPVSQDRRYLGGKTFGPYVGQVVDAETRAPIEGAVVVASWWRDRVWPGASISERYAAREVVTDREGRFVLDATHLEEYAPGGTLRPTFTVFFPGYLVFSPLLGPAFREPGFLQGEFSPRGVLVGLPRLKTEAERRHQVGRISPRLLSPQPFSELPRFTRLLDQEAIAVGLQPRGPKE